MTDLTPFKDVSDLEIRRTHISELRSLGIDPYPAEAFVASHTLGSIRSAEHELCRDGTLVQLAGRLISRRSMGRAVFLDLIEEGERLQLYLSQPHTPEKIWDLLNYLDLGDFLGAEGRLFRTHRGELTLRVDHVKILGKGLRFPPIGKRTTDGDAHQALADTGRLLRDRHVALMADPILRRRVIQRDQIIRTIRSYFHDRGFTEVETPVLSRYYGGAAALPFVTHSHALDADLYLRVSPECGLKRLLCGGMSKVFEIGKNFRNESVDRNHSPEFSAVEWYEINSDYWHQMQRFEELVSRLAQSVHDSNLVRFRGHTLDFSPPWPRLRVIDAVAEAMGVSPEQLTLELMLERWKVCAVQGNLPTSWGESLMAMFETLVEPNLLGPVFVIDHPVEVSPLTKRHRADPRLVERFEPYIGGLEVGNAYSELNDPVEQRLRLVEQDLARDEPYGVDEMFLGAMEDGMPQAGGSGMGIDRIVMILTDAERLADIMLFPTV